MSTHEGRGLFLFCSSYSLIPRKAWIPSRFAIKFLLNTLMKRLCFGGLITDNYLFIIYSKEPMLVHRASPPWADEGELACGTPAEPANSEISIIHWCFTKILILLFAQVFHMNVVWKIQLFLSLSWCPAKPNSIDWNIACWCFCKAKEVDGNLPPLCWMV